MAAEKRIADLKELEVKEINKRKSGEAFEVILKQQNENVENPLIKAVTPKKELSMGDIEAKMRSAEERRTRIHMELKTQLKAEDEKVLRVKQKKAEVNDQFSQVAQISLETKMSQYDRNRLAQINERVKKLQTQNLSAEEIREKVKSEFGQTAEQMQRSIEEKLMKSEELRKKQLRDIQEKQKEKENHAQLVRQKKTTNNCEE